MNPSITLPASPAARAGRRLFYAVATAVLLAVASPPLTAAPRIPTYADLQTFKGQAYFKDESLWIYSRSFADTFRMPEQGVDTALVGIEAAAFRIQAAELQCGLAGRDENCRRNERCFLEVYVDESKHPLPWSTDQSADWLSLTDSAGWLYHAQTGAPASLPLPAKVERPTIWSLMPWVDEKVGQVAMYYEGGTDTPPRSNHWQLLAFKRHVVGQLTMLRFNYDCDLHKKNTAINVRLELREGGIRTPVLKRFHEFQLPDAFAQRMDQRIRVQIRKEGDQFKQLLNIK